MSNQTEKVATATQLPMPSGFKILCAVPEIDQTFGNSGIVKEDTTRTVEEHSTVVLFVVELGPDAYADERKFPSGAWCKKGDFVITRAFSGTRIKIHGKEFRLINDDQVEATVLDPRGYSRV